MKNIINKILENKNDLIEDSFCYSLFEERVFDFKKLKTLVSFIDEYNINIKKDKIAFLDESYKDVNDTLCWILSSTYKTLIYHYNKDDLYKIQEFKFGDEEDAINAVDTLAEHIFSIMRN